MERMTRTRQHLTNLKAVGAPTEVRPEETRTCTNQTQATNVGEPTCNSRIPFNLVIEPR